MALVSDYVGKIPSYNRVQPNYNAWASAVLAPVVALTNIADNLQSAFDIDTAVGAQLDIIGLWVGVARLLSVPISNVFFSFDIAGLGFDQGVWLGPYQSSTQYVSLDDDHYRFLLRSKIARNHWDCRAATAFSIYSIVFTGIPVNVLIADNQNMTMTVTIQNSAKLTAVQRALINSGYIDVRPMGVSLTYVLS